MLWINSETKRVRTHFDIGNNPTHPGCSCRYGELCHCGNCTHCFKSQALLSEEDKYRLWYYVRQVFVYGRYEGILQDWAERSSKEINDMFNEAFEDDLAWERKRKQEAFQRETKELAKKAFLRSQEARQKQKLESEISLGKKAIENLLSSLPEKKTPQKELVRHVLINNRTA